MSWADHEIRGREIERIIDFFEEHGVPDPELITGDMHDLVGQPDSAAEVLFRKTGGGVCVVQVF